MHRIDTKTAQVDKFGAGKNGYTNGDKTVGRLATQLDADVFDAFQEEICSVIEIAGIALNKTDRAQLLKALKSLFLSKSENLGDVDNIAKALENLGLNNVGNWAAVQANGGKHSSGNHRIYMDWGEDAKLHITVDLTDVGELFTTQNPPTAAQTDAYPMAGGYLDGDASVTVISNAAGNIPSGQAIYSPMYRATIKDRGGDMDFKDGASACFRMVEIVSNYAYAQILVDGFGIVKSFEFRNDGSFHAPSSVYAGEGFVAPDGNLYGPVWGGYLNNWITQQISSLVQSINNVANTASDAWNNRVADVALGARWTGILPGGGGLESPGAGYVMTGWYTEGSNPGGDTLVFRPIQKYLPSMGWVNVGHTS